jgi:hypothetical protein
MKQRTASGMRALAGKIDEELPGMVAPQHLRDAARALESGNYPGAKRHLQAAMHTMAPMSLTRHGVLDDDGHSKAKVNMDLINRHHLLVADLEDGEAHNQDIRATPATFTQPGNLPMGASMNPLKLPGAAADGGPSAPKSARAAMVPAPQQNTGTDRTMAGGPKAPTRGYAQLPGRPTPQAVLSWADVDRLIELSAQTARLAVTPAPYGRPGGPGLYGVKGQKHSDYFEQIVKALRQKRGMSKGRASAIAWGALKRWSGGGGHVRPEVRAAAGGALVEEHTKHGHSHSTTWGDVLSAIEMAGTAAGAAQDPRIAVGQVGAGQFGAGQGAGATSQQAGKKAALAAQAAQDRAMAAEYVKMLASMQKSSTAAQTAAAAASKKTTAQTAAATKAGATGKSKSSTPAKKTVSAKTPAVVAHATFKAKTAGMNSSQQAGWLQQTVKSLLSQAAALTKQAAAL